MHSYLERYINFKKRIIMFDINHDEYHFVLECNIYTDLRTQYIPNYYRCRPNIYNFVDLLNIENYQKTGCCI